MSFVRLAFVSLVVAVPLAAQGRQVTLGPATARATEPLSLVTTVRELASGALMVADPIEKKLLRFDAALKAATTIGREGGGPGEYRQPDAVWPFPGDSTLVTDLGNARLSVVGPGGAFGRSIPMAGGASGGPPSVIFPGGVDARGNIYFAPPAGGGRLDSTDVVRVDAKGGAAQPVARLKSPDLDRQESGSANARQVRIRPIPLSASDTWGVAADGRLAVFRSGDYHMEWIGNGPTKVGAPVKTTRVKIGTAEKKEWVSQQMLSGGINMQVQEENGRRTMSFGRARPTEEPDTEGYKWPALKPYFESGAVRIDAAGRAWVRRLREAGQLPLYDVFGADGALVGSVTFPKGRTLLGFGAKGLYAADVDDDGVYTLERYALPL